MPDAFDLTLVPIQIAYTAASGGGAVVLGADGAREIQRYVERISEKLIGGGWTGKDGDRLRAALPLAGNVVAQSAAAAGRCVANADDVAKGVAVLEASSTRLCDDS